MITRVDVNLDALRHNTKQVLGALNPQSRLLAVVKANAYGHGLVESARAFISAGASWLGVSTLAEGVALREAGIENPVLVFLPPLPEECADLVHHQLVATVVAVPQIRELAGAAQNLGQPAYCHLYVDTGLSRIGSDDSLPDMVEAARAFPSLQIAGIYTHFGPPGSGRMLDSLDSIRAGASTKAFAAFARDAMAQVGEARPLVHVASSGLFLEDRYNHLDMVRIGTLLYGQYPDHVKERSLDLREDTFALRSRIIALQTVPPESKIGYGGEFICRHEMRVATVPVGTAQGLGMVPQSVAGRWQSAVKALLTRRAGRRGRSDRAPQASIRGNKAPLLGRISMDQCCLDVTHITEVTVGDEVTLPCRRLSVDSRVPRQYIEDQQ